MEIVIEKARFTCNGKTDWLIVAKDGKNRMVIESCTAEAIAEKSLKYWEGLKAQVEEWFEHESKRVPETISPAERADRQPVRNLKGDGTKT